MLGELCEVKDIGLDDNFLGVEICQQESWVISSSQAEYIAKICNNISRSRAEKVGVSKGKLW